MLLQWRALVPSMPLSQDVNRRKTCGQREKKAREQCQRPPIIAIRVPMFFFPFTQSLFHSRQVKKKRRYHKPTIQKNPLRIPSRKPRITMGNCQSARPKRTHTRRNEDIYDYRRDVPGAPAQIGYEYIPPKKRSIYKGQINPDHDKPRPNKPKYRKPQSPVRYRNDTRLVENQNARPPHDQKSQGGTLKPQQMPKKPESARQNGNPRRIVRDSGGVYPPVPANSPYFRPVSEYRPIPPENDYFINKKTPMPALPLPVRVDSSKNGGRGRLPPMSRVQQSRVRVDTTTRSSKAVAVERGAQTKGKDRKGKGRYTDRRVCSDGKMRIKDNQTGEWFEPFPSV